MVLFIYELITWTASTVSGDKKDRLAESVSPQVESLVQTVRLNIVSQIAFVIFLTAMEMLLDCIARTFIKGCKSLSTSSHSL